VTILRRAIREQLDDTGNNELAAFKAVAKRWVADTEFREATKDELVELIQYPIGGEFSEVVDEAIATHDDPGQIERMIDERLDERENPSTTAAAQYRLLKAGVEAIRRVVWEERQRRK